ncbi:hypothetical protein VE03_10331 [Pseudogymnoascus sp. 23342-1-I1]|nr:hypothetical protein VE03_10331 [Pseudogymnoascus sp. 23342-1-I1]
MTPTTIAQISRLELQDLSTPLVATITDVKQLSSYNWIEAPLPTIVVPGTPPLWSPPSGPRQLKKDSGLIYIAQNAARHPDSPLEPLFRALCITNPSFDIRSIDVVTDRNNIRKLLSFINPSMTRNGLETFTINIEVAKDTAIFCRDETTTQEFIGPHEFKGYGREFEKVYTTRQIGASTGHHRIITYRFGGLNFVVRHETDGYVNTDTRIPSPDAKGPESDSLSSTFPVPEVEDVAADIKTWEEGNQRDLRKLAALISKIVDVVKGCGGNAIVKYDILGDKLVIWKVDRKKMLPNDLYSIWDDRAGSEASSIMV